MNSHNSHATNGSSGPHQTTIPLPPQILHGGSSVRVQPDQVYGAAAKLLYGTDYPQIGGISGQSRKLSHGLGGASITSTAKSPQLRQSMQLPSIAKQQALQVMWGHFKSSGLPPLMSRRTTVTNDLKAMLSTSQHSRPRDGSNNQMKKGSITSKHKRFDSVNVRHSNKLGGISQSRYGQNNGASLLEDSSYTNSLARSKALLYNEASLSNHNKSTAIGSVSNRIDGNAELSQDESKRLKHI